MAHDKLGTMTPVRFSTFDLWALKSHHSPKLRADVSSTVHRIFLGLDVLCLALEVTLPDPRDANGSR